MPRDGIRLGSIQMLLEQESITYYLMELQILQVILYINNNILLMIWLLDALEL